MALICLEAACESSQSGLAVQKCFSTKSLRVFLNQISSKKQCRSHEALYNIFKANIKNLKHLLFVLIQCSLGFYSICSEPNKITLKDFDGWVQERGLYFPGSWDDKYEALLSSNDKGEKARNGGLLVAKYGKGYYIYNGYSMFRELPAGVPGAFRLFVNMVSLGNEMPQKIKYGHNQD